MKKPIIGITLDNENPGHYSKFPWYAIRKNYIHSVEKLGGFPFPLFHSLTNIKNIFSLIDGIIITGGNFDINPSLYSESDKGSRKIKDIRTKFEIDIFKKFLETSKPILGICGGEQLMNIATGGDLIQDINQSIVTEIKHEQINPRNEVSHEIILKKNSKIYNITKKNKIKVNSAHHQSVNKLGKNFISSALATDGVIEAIEHIKHPWCLGVQWHPEFLITKSDIAIIEDFVKNAL